MKTESINTTWINSTMVDIYIDPSKTRYNDNETANLNLTWETVSYQDQYLKIKLNFDHPYAISMTEVYDQLVVNLKQRDFFISQDFLTDLSNHHRVLKKKI